MNQSPILLKIASHCDKDTFFNLMLVNKKAYQVIKYLLHSAPTVFITMYWIDTSEELPVKVIYKSLKELYTELHQTEIHRFPKNYNYTLGWTRHPDGKCIECLTSKIDRCGCGDSEYSGIRMVKYISPYPTPEIINTYKLEYEWCTELSPLDDSFKGFRISKILHSEDEHTHYMDEEVGIYRPPHERTSLEINYKSMYYLYRGCTKTPFSLKQGVKQYSYKQYYPITTENIDLFDCIYKSDVHKKLYLKINTREYIEFPRTI